MLAHTPSAHTSAVARAKPAVCRSSGRRGCPSRTEAFAAEDGAALGGTERHCSFFSAARTGGLSLNLGVAVALSGRGRCAEYRNPFGLAGFATLGLVLELLVVEEKLFPGGEHKITPTIDTLQHLVLKFHLRMAPFSPFLRAIRGERIAVDRRNRLSTSPLVLPLGLGPSRLLERSVGTDYLAYRCRKTDEYELSQLRLNLVGARLSRAAPGWSGPFSLQTSLALYEFSCVLFCARARLLRAFSRRASGRRSDA